MTAKKMIPEIQGLRAIAVITVVIYHIWPSAIPGGFTGVDIFFVISGYLITNILVKDLIQNGHVDYIKFYSRRVARLAPAAGAVILCTLIFHQVFSPLYHKQIFDESISSTFFYQNWKLAYDAVDYLDADNPASPLQHFWSLSVEEQYYLFWPLLIFVLSIGFAGRKKALTREWIRNILVIITITSLAYSIYQSYTNGSFAYFNFFTRIWELGIGSILAVTVFWQKLQQRLYGLLGLAGLALIVLGIVTIEKTDAFPGYIAILPTLGCALLIIYASASKKIQFLTLLLNNKISQFFGDISYSLYLWHWPIVILLMGDTDNIVVMGMLTFLTATVFAGFSKNYIEDTFRSKSDTISIVGIIAICMILPLMLSHQSESLTKITSPKNESASAVREGLATAKEDKPQTYADKCYASMKSSEVVSCAYGDLESSKNIVVVGDSHLMHWLPALRKFAQHHSYKVIPINKSACFVGWSGAMDILKNNSCRQWNEAIIPKIKDLNPEMIIISQSIGHTFKKDGAEKAEVLASALGNFIENFSKDKVILIKDVPWMGQDIPECLSQNQPNYEECHMNRDEVVDRVDRKDPLVIAAKEFDIQIIDMTSELCDEDLCYAYDEWGIRWRDSHHLTASFVNRIAPSFSQKLLDTRKR